MPELLALLDLGSNAARFVLARINPGVGYRVLQKERIQTRLGDGRAGELPPDAVALTLSSVRGFLERLGITSTRSSRCSPPKASGSYAPKTWTRNSAGSSTSTSGGRCCPW